VSLIEPAAAGLYYPSPSQFILTSPFFTAFFLPLSQGPNAPSGGPGGPGGQPPFKLNIVESIERIKEEFNFLQAQYHK